MVEGDDGLYRPVPSIQPRPLLNTDVGIARALYNRADLVQFDKAKRALDNATEYEVLRDNDALSGNKTLVMIAQRLSTLRSCDHIPLLRQGEIVGIWEALECDYSEFRYIAQGSDRKRDS